MILRSKSAHFETEGLVAIREEPDSYGHMIVAYYSNGQKVILGMYEKTQELSNAYEDLCRRWEYARLAG